MTIRRVPPLLMAALWALIAWGLWQAGNRPIPAPPSSSAADKALLGFTTYQREVRELRARVEVLERLSRGELPRPVEEK